MPQCRLTQKFAKDCRINYLTAPNNTDSLLDDWFIDVMYFNRKKVAIVTHGKSTFTLFIPYSEAGGAVNVPKHIGMVLNKFFISRDFIEHAEKVVTLFNEKIIYCKTVDRKILGHMKDFKYCASFKHNAPINFNKISDYINHMPINFHQKNLSYPIQILGKLLGIELYQKEKHE